MGAFRWCSDGQLRRGKVGFGRLGIGSRGLLSNVLFCFVGLCLGSIGQFCCASDRFVGESPGTAVTEGGENLGRFDKGVTSYTFAECTITVSFPEEEHKCRWCRFLTHNDGLDRDKCFLTGDIIYSKEMVGINCPLVILNTVDAKEIKK